MVDGVSRRSLARRRLIWSVVFLVFGLAMIACSYWIKSSLSNNRTVMTTEHEAVYRAKTNVASEIVHRTYTGQLTEPVRGAWEKRRTIVGTTSLMVAVHPVDHFAEDSSVSCEILVDGRVVESDSESGPGASALCVFIYDPLYSLG